MDLPRNVLFANDFSKGSLDALPYALHISKEIDATLHVAYVDVLQKDIFTNDVRPSGPVDKVRSHLKKYIGRQAKATRYDPESLRVKHHVIKGTSASWALRKLAGKIEADLIIMGTQGRGGASKLLLGSVASEVVRSAPCDVLTVGERLLPEPVRIEHIVAPVDFSEASARGLDIARRWAERFGAGLTVMIATYQHIHPDMYAPSLKSIEDITELVIANMKDRLRRFYEQATSSYDKTEFVVETGDAARTISKYILKHKPDLAVLSTHGHSGFARFALGSVTEKVIRLSTCPVLTVRPPRGSSEPAQSIEVDSATR